jgi:CAAX protease family protein
MTGIRPFIVKQAVTTYFVLTFAISWGGVLLVIGSRGLMGSAPVSDSRFAFVVLAMLAGPSISGILMTALVGGRSGLRDLVSRTLTWRVDVRWQAVALLTAPLAWTATIIALALVSSMFLPGIVTTPDKLGRVLLGVAVAIGAGIFEELGWTGFAVPQLRRRHSLLATGVTVGVLWGAWHLLTNVIWAARATAGDLPLSIFVPVSTAGLLVGYLVAFRVLMVWVYDHTNSVLLAILMHVSLTASVLILDPISLSGSALLTYSFSVAVAVWAAVAIVAPGQWHVPHRTPHGRWSYLE